MKYLEYNYELLKALFRFNRFCKANKNMDEYNDAWTNGTYYYHFLLYREEGRTVRLRSDVQWGKI